MGGWVEDGSRRRWWSRSPEVAGVDEEVVGGHRRWRSPEVEVEEEVAGVVEEVTGGGG